MRMPTSVARPAVGLALGLALVSSTLVATSPAHAAPGPATPATPATGDAGERALDLLAADPGEHGLTAADVSGLVVADVVPSTTPGLTHVYLQQQVGGIDVAEAIVNIAIKDGAIARVASTAVRGAADLVNTDEPAVTDVQAAGAASAALDLAPTESFRSSAKAKGADLARDLGDGGVSTDPIPANLVYQQADDGSLRLAWQLAISPADGESWWQMRMDAVTGRELERQDWVAHAGPDSETYTAYPLSVEAPSFGDRTTETDPADEVASPYGWLDTDGVAGADTTLTDGNNVHAYLDTNNDNLPDAGSEADGGVDHVFDFPLDLSQAPSAYQDAAVTNLFTVTNRLHDVLYRYGFTEAAGNFQVDNYDRGGAGGDALRAEAQDGGRLDNANFATPPDGQQPRMQMYLWSGTLKRDGDLDAGVIAHEYGHGVSNRLTGGPATSSCLQNGEQPGEGWSDFFSYLLTGESGGGATEPVAGRTVGTYATARVKGIRSQPYSTDPAVNTKHYDDIKVATSGGDVLPHDVGEVWAQMLWQLTRDLIDEHGYDSDIVNGHGGNNIALQLVMDGLKLQPCSPGFVDARDAIIAADQLTNGGADECLIWRSFARDGLGYSATQGSSSLITDGHEAYDLPPTCAGLVATTTTTPARAVPGRTLTHQVALRNTTGATLTGATASASIGTGATYVEGSATCPATYDAGTRTVQLTAGTIAAGATRTCAFGARVAPGASSSLVLDDDLDAGLGGWRVAHTAGSKDWEAATVSGRGGVVHATAPGTGGTDQTLTLAEPVTVPAGAELHFDQRNAHEVESATVAFDGGQVLISTDGTTWTDLAPAFTSNGPLHTMYDVLWSGAYTTAIPGEPVFAGGRDGWVHSVADLGAYAGQSVWLRFRSVTDENVGSDGWWLDDVEIGRPVRVAVDVTAAADGVAPHGETVSTRILAPLPPAAVTRVSATVASPTSASVSFTAGDDGGADVTAYTVACTAPGAGTATVTGTASPVLVQGLRAGASYSCRVRATNEAGDGPWSATSASYLQAVRPLAPGVARVRMRSAKVAKVTLAPKADGGSPVLRYSVTCVPTKRGRTRAATGAAPTLVVRGLSKGKRYRCRATATTAAGSSPLGPWSKRFRAVRARR